MLPILYVSCSIWSYAPLLRKYDERMAVHILTAALEREHVITASTSYEDRSNPRECAQSDQLPTSYSEGHPPEVSLFIRPYGYVGVQCTDVLN